MAFRDADGRATGFSVEVARAVCAEMKARCEFQVMVLDPGGRRWPAAKSTSPRSALLDTPNGAAGSFLPTHPSLGHALVRQARRGTGPARSAHRRGQGLGPGEAYAARRTGIPSACRPAAISAHRCYRCRSRCHRADEYQPAFAGNKDFQRLGLAATVMKVPELVGNASFGINPRRPELKTAVDDALERIKRNGVTNGSTRFLPFRVH